MKLTTILTALIGTVALVASTTSAGAQTFETEPPPEAIPQERTMLQEWGTYFEAGGGVANFTDSETRDVVKSPAGAWDARVGFGAKKIIGFEVGYVGTSQGTESLSLEGAGLDPDSSLIGTSIEGLVRLNGLPGSSLQPYAFVGGGWQHYSLTNEEFNTSKVEDTSNAFVLPVGGGVAYKFGDPEASGFLLDLRGAFRPAWGDELNRVETASGSDMSLTTWNATLRLGYVF